MNRRPIPTWFTDQFREFRDGNGRLCRTLDTLHGQLSLDLIYDPHPSALSEDDVIIYLNSNTVTGPTSSFLVCGYANVHRTGSVIALSQAMLQRDTEFRLGVQAFQFFGYGGMWRMVSREFDPWFETHFYEDLSIKRGYLATNASIRVNSDEFIVAGVANAMESSWVEFSSDGTLRSFLDSETGNRIEPQA